MNSATRRIAAETYQRASDAIANKEAEGAEFSVWWDRLAGALQGGLAGPRTWERLKAASANMSGGTYDEELEGGTATATNEDVDLGPYED